MTNIFLILGAISIVAIIVAAIALSLIDALNQIDKKEIDEDEANIYN